MDGEFGEDTMSAVKLFQSDKGLLVDGEVGPDTWKALRGRT
ncbi:peptidoglycan-binding domain-containing protein [Streptomyces sp. NPDC048389]